MWKVPFFDLDYGEDEQAAVLGVLADKWLTAGPRIQEFEEAFAGLIGSARGCVAVSSCTAALHLALLALDIGPGDEVILPALSFVAGLNVTRLCGATPVLADCASLEDWNIDPADILAKVTPRTKAVMIVHFAGMPCDMDEIAVLCRDRGLPLIEDAAHATGAWYKGRHCGTFGDFGCFSFFSNKNLAVGEGGMICANGEELTAKVRLMRSHGMSRPTIERHQGRAFSYDVGMPGLNYRMDEMRAALGLVQLGRLAAANQRRKELCGEYRERLAGLPLVMPWPEPPRDRESAHHIFPVLLPPEADREGFMSHMKDAGIQTSLHYPSYRSFTAYGPDLGGETPAADEISLRVVTLPLFPGMTEEQLDLVCRTAAEFFARRQGE
jgi:dTDP-4-amino-4,6-dideoxygalactose transaminase